MVHLWRGVNHPGLGKSICRSLGMKQETGNYNLVKSYRAGLPRVCP